MFDLSGRCALLTGAGRGIGLAVARALAGAGCAVAIQDLDESIARSAAEAINRSGGRAVAFGGDLTDLSLPGRLVPRVVEALGGLHILVNNGSIQIRRHWTEASTEEMELQLRTDLVSPVLFCREVVPIFKRQRFGRIINVGSVQQIHATPDLLAYSLSKGALEKLTTGLAKELAPDQITINQIAPGWIHNTVRNADNFKTPEDVIETGKRAVPLGRLGEPEDMRGTVVLLCSDAGAFITGQNVFIDGGMGW
jgi:NAD(P)-dependent dehydrogenase (short-subunit alcohol dehydrogenase family)